MSGSSLGLLIANAVVAFAGTNLDDLFVLVVYFSRRPEFSTCQVVAGQVLGFSFICALSLLGLLLGLFVPSNFIGLLGFVPILMVSFCRGAHHHPPPKKVF
jgi:cadmium resistance protein CadD (predicted permease)